MTIALSLTGGLQQDWFRTLLCLSIVISIASGRVKVGQKFGWLGHNASSSPIIGICKQFDISMLVKLTLIATSCDISGSLGRPKLVRKSYLPVSSFWHQTVISQIAERRPIKSIWGLAPGWTRIIHADILTTPLLNFTVVKTMQNLVSIFDPSRLECRLACFDYLYSEKKHLKTSSDRQVIELF